MAREKIKKHHKPGEHIWESMEKYKLGKEIVDWFGGDIEDEVNILRKMKPNVYFVVMTLPAKETNTQPFLDYIERLRSYDLKIDKSDTAEYGYKMPSAEKGKPYRELRIFRRGIIREEKIFRRK